MNNERCQNSLSSNHQFSVTNVNNNNKSKIDFLLMDKNKTTTTTTNENSSKLCPAAENVQKKFTSEPISYSISSSTSSNSNSSSSHSSVSASLSLLSNFVNLKSRESTNSNVNSFVNEKENQTTNNNNNNNNNDKKNMSNINPQSSSSSSQQQQQQDSGFNSSQTDNKNFPKIIKSNPSLIENQNSKDSNSGAIKYGELIVLGYNGCIDSTPLTKESESNLNSNVVSSSRRKSKFVLKAREKSNGVKPAVQHNCQSSQEVNNLMMKNESHSVTYTLSRNHTVVVQYARDEKTDMYQIGRSTESAIDFIVLDTLVSSNKLTSSAPNFNLYNNESNNSPSNNNNNNNNNSQQSTISRYSCRIVVDRSFPYTARIYAAGFDSSKRIFLGEKATKWKNEKGELDGVTTNGVLIMHPKNGFADPDVKSNEWLEVSVCGAVFGLNESRLVSPFLNKPIKDYNSIKSNILRDGTLIDLCGATLLWRSTESLKKTPNKSFLEMNLEHLNRLRPQCPVGLKTLVFPSSASPQSKQQQQQSSSLASQNNPKNNNNLQQGILNLNYLNKHLDDSIPMVYLRCGHVHGQHDWGVKKNNERECPLCRKVGPYVQLLIGLEPSFYCDNNIITGNNNYSNNNNNYNLFRPYAFLPCGHMSSEATCTYWSKILVPQGATQGLCSVCPFCAVPLCKEQPYVKLIFQEAH